MRFEQIETIRRSDFRHSDFRLSDGIEGDSFSVMSHGQHGSGRFLDFARNDGRRLETIRRETSDGQISDGQTSDGPFGPFVGGLYNHRGPPLLVKSYNRAFGAKGKHADQAAPVGNAPLSPLRGTSTRRGKFALHSVFALISNARHSAGKSAPLRGKGGALAPKGVYFQRAKSGFAVFPSPLEAVLMVFTISVSSLLTIYTLVAE